MNNRFLVLMAGKLLCNGRIVRHFLTNLLLLAVLFLVSPSPVFSAEYQPQAADLVADDQPIDVTDKRYRDLFQELEEQYHFTKPQLSSLFTNLRIDRKVLQLMDRQGEAKPYYQYRTLFITPSLIVLGKQNLEMHRQLFDRIEAEFGVDREIIVAIWAIETRFGTNQGGFNLFQTLNTLFAAYPRRSQFFRKELIDFVTLCRSNGIDPWSVKGSYAGAFGQAQFMPSSFAEYAVDFDGDQRRDIINSLPDIFASIANYLKRFGWTLHAPVYSEIGLELRSEALTEVYNEGRKGRVDWRQLAKIQNLTLPRPPQDQQLSIFGLELPPQDGGGMRFIAGYPNLQAITEYNHSSKYAMAVAEMAEAFKNHH
jgi:membrane-bound lytic murein transglycosylase B